MEGENTQKGRLHQTRGLGNFLTEDLLPRLEPGAVLVLDNASSHHDGEVREIVQDAGCWLLSLPIRLTSTRSNCLGMDQALHASNRSSRCDLPSGGDTTRRGILAN